MSLKNECEDKNVTQPQNTASSCSALVGLSLRGGRRCGGRHGGGRWRRQGASWSCRKNLSDRCPPVGKEGSGGGESYQSSKLSGKYSYSMSPFSRGLSPTACAVAGADFINRGLDSPPSGVERLELRSSSDRDKLMGSVGPVCLGMVVLGVVLAVEGSEPSEEDHAGTGGRAALGDRAIFLGGGWLCCCAYCWALGVAHSPAAC